MDKRGGIKIKYQIKEIPNFEGYYADTDGNIFSCYNVGNHKIEDKIHRKLKINYGSTDEQKRPRVSVCRNSKRYSRFIHTLILETFIGKRPEDMECCHNDGNNKNNKLSNLRWDTRKSNAEDMVKHGRSTRGVKNPQNKLTEEQVREIRTLLKKTDLRQWQIADQFNVSRSTINDINNGYNWKYLED